MKMKVDWDNEFIQAAERIAIGYDRFACWAIYDLFDERKFEELYERDYFYSEYSPDDDTGNVWFGNANIEENQMARSLALLFAAEFYAGE